MNTAPIISKVWSFCTTLRDDGVGYGDYLEQLTYLIFLKMADITLNSGALVQLGPAYLGEIFRAEWATPQIHLHSWITDGTRMQPRL